MDMNPELLQAIANVGFPIMIAAFVLIRLDKSLQTLRDEIKGLRADLAAGRRPSTDPIGA